MTDTTARYSNAIGLIGGAFIIIVVLVSTFILLKSADYIIGWQYKGSSLYPETMQPIVFDIYPYSYQHMGANLVWQTEIHTGQMGYWYPDFDFNNPPRKAANEFRIVLIGGSGAQGQGQAMPNSKMLYAQIEARLNEYGKQTGKTFRVINMAMGGTRTYHNFIDLNLFGRKLEPDLILTYSGFNDWILATFFERDRKLFRSEGCVAQTSERASSKKSLATSIPTDLNFLARIFPNLFFISPYTDKVSFRSLFARRPSFPGFHYYTGTEHCYDDENQFFDQAIVPLYVSSLKSIKRDFPGIPIMIAWQAIETDPDEFAPYGDPLKKFGVDFYNKMFERAKAETKDYRDDRWIYLNVHRMYQSDLRLFGFHLTPEAQAIVGDAIAQRLMLYFDPTYARAHPDVAKAIASENYRLDRGVEPLKAAGAPPEWSEDAYLLAYPEVKALVQAGQHGSGWAYFREKGKAEGKVEGSPMRWNERGYLVANPDVAYFVRRGVYSSGYDHWLKAGKTEKRRGGAIE